ncbi:MAG TPA: RNA-binding protein [Candidatus Kapabacteria bacterium]|jgi:RNA recognition motif-containing protein|nr:RNA-binding protein [Candidatus Kapabacteria bacterium]HZV13570.1 RNA-binding protein [Candidatus Kapabacteria bacterium]
MSKRLYVGGLPYSVDDNRLSSLFASFGTVVSANVIRDRATGRSKGFGFVEMENPANADEAINALNGSELEGRSITVNEARPMEQRSGGGGGDRRGGGGGRRW